ncbi:MAG: hypothetical protein ABF747_02295 [Bifidobacterium sp.]|uniref:Uncharacterized protein n=1 Tax=Bifidobacterium fermentum TaxID=3059035 RepID=A0AB39URY6_9BIFI
MTNVVKLNFAAFTAFRQDGKTQAAIVSEAEKLAGRANAMHVTAGAEYDATPARASTKGSTSLVSTGNTKARVDQAAHNTLLKALGGG